MPTREFPGFTLTITPISFPGTTPINIKVSVFRSSDPVKTYEREFNEEQISELHAIFFDPSLILDIDEMVPDLVSFDAGYCEIRWKFEIRKRCHLVSMRLPEETPPEGCNPELFELRKELATCQREIRELRMLCTTEKRVAAYHLYSSSHCKYIMEDCVISQSSVNLDVWVTLFRRSFGTSYGKYMAYDGFFLDEEVQNAYFGYLQQSKLSGFSIQASNSLKTAVSRYFRKQKMIAASHEIEFNLEFRGVSIEEFDIITSPAVRFSLEPEIKHQDMHVIARGAKSKDCYAYLFRDKTQPPPDVFVKMFDIEELYRIKEKKLGQQFSDMTPLQIVRSPHENVEGLKIYKVQTC